MCNSSFFGSNNCCGIIILIILILIFCGDGFGGCGCNNDCGCN